MKPFILVCLLSFSVLTSCRKEDSASSKVYDFNFNSGHHGWEALFSDFPVGEEANYALQFSHSPLPAPLDPSIKSLKVSGNNHSDDLLSMIWRKIDSLVPNREYEISFQVALASNVKKHSFGAGGAPDQAIGAGALSFKPASKVEKTGNTDYYRPNFLSLLQRFESNRHFKVLGTLGVTKDTEQYTLISRNNLAHPIRARANEKGELWLLVGIDSGFEGITTLYYKSIHIRLR